MTSPFPIINPPVTLETARLILRPWRASDHAPFAALNGDPEVMRHFPSTLTPEQSNAVAVRIQELIGAQGYGWWAAEEKGGAPFIGFVGIGPVPDDLPFAPAVEVGWRLATPYWGKGYATEGARAVLDFCWNQLNGTEVVAVTAAGNGPSRRVMERIGMHYDPAADFIHPRPPADSPHRHSVLYRVMAPGGSAAPGGSSK